MVTTFKSLVELADFAAQVPGAAGEEEAEEGALFRTPERECLLAHGDFKRPENAKLEMRMPLRGSMVRPSFCE